MNIKISKINLSACLFLIQPYGSSMHLCYDIPVVIPLLSLYQELKTCAAIINIFDMIPAASAKFIAQLTALVLKGERDLLLEVSKGSSRYIVLLYARGYVWQHWLYLHTVCHLVKCARTGKIYEKI